MVIPLAWHICQRRHFSDTLTHCTEFGSTGIGGHEPRPIVPPKPLSRQGSCWARSTGSHCGGTATAWLASANLLAAMDLVMCGVKAAWKAAATPMRMSARKPGASFFADFLVLLVQSVGTGNVANLLC